MKFFEFSKEEIFQQQTRSKVSVPSDFATLQEAIKQAQPGSQIKLEAGEHSWDGRLEVDKAIHICGEVDKATGYPSTFLKGRWRISVPPPLPWDQDPLLVGTFSNCWCECEGGYTFAVMGGEWQMYNCRIFCKHGSALSIPKADVGLHDCVVGCEKDTNGVIANYGIALCEGSKAWIQSSSLRNCKHGVFMRDTADVRILAGEFTRVSIAFGCILPNDCGIEVLKTRFYEVEHNWHQNSRPTRLFQEGNYNESGHPVYIHGDSDGQHVFQTQDLTNKY